MSPRVRVWERVVGSCLIRAPLWHACPPSMMLTRVAHTCRNGRRAQDYTPPCGRKIDAVTEEDLLLYVLLSSNLALGYSEIL